MSDTNVVVLLKLNDELSEQLNKALENTKDFGTGFDGAMKKVDKTLDSMTKKLAMFGLNIGATATINNMIKFEDRINRLNSKAKASIKDIEEYKEVMGDLSEEIYRVATLPEIKMDADELLSTMEAIDEKTGNLIFAEKNLESMGLAIRAFNTSGTNIGSMFAEFDKLNFDGGTISTTLDRIYTQGTKGSFKPAMFARNTPQIIKAYSPIGNSADDITNANAAMQILMASIGDETKAVAALRSLISDLGGESAQKNLKKYGISAYNANGKMRDLNDIMLDIVSVQKKLKGKELTNFISAFGDMSQQGILAFIKHGDKLSGFLDYSDSLNSAKKASEESAQSLKANLQNIQTSYDKFINKNGSSALSKITNLLNNFAKNPERFDMVFKIIAGGLIGLGAIKIASSVFKTINFFKSLMGLGGKNIKIPGLIGQAGSGIPVFVTNLPGANMQGNMTMPKPIFKLPNIKGVDILKNMRTGSNSILFNKSLMTRLGIAGLLAGAVISIPQAVGRWQEINKDTTLNAKEKRKQKGGVIGNTAGTILGMAGGVMAGAATGAAIGSVIPVFGTAIVAVVGGLVGVGMSYLGGNIGQSIGENIAEATAGEDATSTNKPLQITTAKAEITGNAKVGIDLKITDERIVANIMETENTINNMRFQTGTLEIAGCTVNPW